MSILVVAEHDGARVRSGSLSALSLARELAESAEAKLELLLIGSGIARVAEEATNFGAVILADDPRLAHPTADSYARVIAEIAKARGATRLIAASTTFAKDILPRVAAILGAAMASDATGYTVTDGELRWRRPMYAGSVMAVVALEGDLQVITIHPSAFPPAERGSSPGELVNWPVSELTLPNRVEYEGTESRPSNRPDLTEARVVVAGGRAFRSAEDFEEHVGKLADALNGAAGCTRALVDAGVTPNEWLVGQTGRTVAPELYVALGISGAVQHLAGMKNSRVVIAVNSDPEAPVFSIANYGLVGDVRRIVPELIRELGR